MNRQGDIDIIPQLGGSASQPSRVYSRPQHDDEYTSASREHGTDATTSASVTIPANAIKSVMGMNNEYWLIGIIIVLVMVVIMLIVYIVRLKNAEELKASTPKSARDRRNAQVQAHAQVQDGEQGQKHRNIVNLPTRSVLQDIANTPFAPRSAHTAQAQVHAPDHAQEHEQEDEQEQHVDEIDQQQDDTDDTQEVDRTAHEQPPRASSSTSAAATSTHDANVD